ncbi:hypothetical protein EV360DRAFT_85878 [Lentinula raphanica]|nr:hypothetical protein EV360DRAFT_85878 [Lentinula raphanica]
MSNPPGSLGSDSTDPLRAYAECVFLQEGLDLDMQGYAVRLSNFVVNVCLALLIRHSEEDFQVADSVTAVLLQNYTLLSCTFISLIRKRLSVADAHFCLTLTISPLALYLVYASLRKVLGRSSYDSCFFRRLDDHYKTCLTFSVLMLPLWIIIYVLIYLNKFFPKTGCPHVTFVSWLILVAAEVGHALTVAYVFTGLIVFVWFVYFLRHFTDIRTETPMPNALDRKWFGWLRWFPLSFKFFMIAQRVIFGSHPWVVTLFIVTAYVIWGSALFLDVLDIHKYFYNRAANLVRNGTTTHGPYTPPAGYEPLGFGQLIAAALAFPPLWKVMCMIWRSREKLLAWVIGYPTSLWHETEFLFTGRPNPWKVLRETRAGSHPTESPSDSIPMTGPNDKVQSLENVLASLPTQEKSINRSESA